MHNVSIVNITIHWLMVQEEFEFKSPMTISKWTKEWHKVAMMGMVHSRATEKQWQEL
jgi:hypothetical protein